MAESDSEGADAPGPALSAVSAAVRNPLSVISLFVLLVEAIATTTLVQVQDSPFAVLLAWFVVLFPVIIAGLFFWTLWNKHRVLYSPMEFRSDEAFLRAMGQIERLEATHEAQQLIERLKSTHDVEQLDETTDQEQSLSVVDRLIRVDNVRAAVKVGRTFLEAKESEAAIGIFSHIDAQLPAAHPIRYNVLANKGYALNNLGRFDEAVSVLNQCIQHAGLRRVRVWHLLARAYAHFKLWKETDEDQHKSAFKSDVAAAKKARWYRAEAGLYTERDPALGKYL